MEKRSNLTSALHTQLSRLLPNCNVHMAIAEGTFEDDDGVGAHFEAPALQPNNPQKQFAALKVDLHVSVAKLARVAAMHREVRVCLKGQMQSLVWKSLKSQMQNTGATFKIRNFQVFEFGMFLRIYM